MKRLLLIPLLLLSMAPLAAQQVVIDEASYGVFAADKPVEIGVEVTSAEDAHLEVSITAESDVADGYHALMHSLDFEAGKPRRVVLTGDFLPGFYRATVRVGDFSESFNFGVEPESIVSERDATPDFDQFWQKTLEELAAVKPSYKLKEMKEHSTAKRRVYRVEMQSLGGETVRGYYLEPTGKGPYPALLTSMGYGSEAWLPGADDSPERAEFILSPRGQGLNNPSTKKQPWVVEGITSPYTYYYRGAYADVVRALDFISSRKVVDKELIFADGGSQGGALTLALCALDDRVAAAAPYVPFMSDFPDYLRIASWPANELLPAAEAAGMSQRELLDMLSYFDIKNLAPRVKCPVLMGFGLQDDVCPPHTNFAGYNQLRVEKRWMVFPRRGHDVHNEPSWYAAREAFFEEVMTQIRAKREQQKQQDN